MTVSYNLNLSTSKPWAQFRLLLRWRGSIWKLVLTECLIFYFTYTIINIFCTFVLAPHTKERLIEFIKWLNPSNKYSFFIPLEFMLGFFVTAILQRWSTALNNLAFIDRIAVAIAGYIHGTSEKCRIIRRNIIRYMCLCEVLVFRDISLPVRKRFPTIDTIVAAGFMLPHEKEIFDSFETTYPKYWVPLQWANLLVYKARTENLIISDIFCEQIFEEIRSFRANLGEVLKVDWVPLPLAYPQLIYLAVHVHFILSLISKQELDAEWWFPKWIPLITLVQFFFYMAWTKVAMVLINPFGEDDDDFETNFLIDRNIKIGILIVDEGYGVVPEQKRDIFWGNRVDPLYSEESAKTTANQANTLVGSATGLTLPENVSKILMMPLNNNDDDDELMEANKFTKRYSIVQIPRSVISKLLIV
ncbi:unnamed protein product [Dracunculus medinensis]|uniref:Bestrophin homolog n=1 Tax=Dracunculus medinensis TaxID=318479 RepID=A0A0N4U107_DRAME|nr:unnamed protein product [Dracunculus medinensis]